MRRPAIVFILLTVAVGNDVYVCKTQNTIQDCRSKGSMIDASFVKLGAPTLESPPQIRGRGGIPYDHKEWMPEVLRGPNGSLPAVFEYNGDSHMASYHLPSDFLIQNLQLSGALVLKGLQIKTAAEFSELVLATNWSFQDYVGGVTKRPEVAPKVQPASAEDPAVSMEYHNDGSFGARPPVVIFLYCQLPPTVGGQALLYDSRGVFQTLKKDYPLLLQELRDRKIRYYTFYPDASKFDGEITLSLQDAFFKKCGDAGNFTLAIEEYLTATKYGFEWTSSGLKTWYIRDPVTAHPVHGEETWFNQVTAMHCSVFDNHPAYASLHRPEDERSKSCEMHGSMQFHTSFGDGDEIPIDVIDTLRRVQWDNAVAFDFSSGDVAVLDNYFVGHGRLSFEPPRELFTAQVAHFNGRVAIE